MRLLLHTLMVIPLLMLGCDDRPRTGEGPAERAGRAVDEATEEAAEAVGKGLEEAGEEIRESVPRR